MMNIKALGLLLGAFIAPALAAPADPSANALDGQYIITLKKDVESVDSHVSWLKERSATRSGSSNGGVNKVWNKSFKGYSGQFDDETLEEIKGNEEVRRSKQRIYIPFLLSV